MGLQDICRDVVAETEGALDCVVVDLHTGLTLASAHEPGSKLSQAQLDAAVRTGTTVFGSKLIGRFCAALANEGRAHSGSVQEIQVATGSNHQFMAAIPGWNDALVILFTEKTLRLGLGWMAVHQAQARCAGSRDAEADPAWEPAAPNPECVSVEIDPEPAMTLPEQPPSTAADPTPIPPSQGPAEEDTIPNPLVARNRSGENTDSTEIAAPAGQPAAAGSQTPAATRGRVFRRRSSRRKH